MLGHLFFWTYILDRRRRAAGRRRGGRRPQDAESRRAERAAFDGKPYVSGDGSVTVAKKPVISI